MVINSSNLNKKSFKPNLLANRFIIKSSLFSLPLYYSLKQDPLWETNNQLHISIAKEELLRILEMFVFLRLVQIIESKFISTTQKKNI